MLTVDEKNFCVQCRLDGAFDHLLKPGVRTALQREIDLNSVIRAMSDEDVRIILRSYKVDKHARLDSQINELQLITITPKKEA